MVLFDYRSGTPWDDVRTAIKKIIITDGVTTIGGYAFYSCSSLTEISIPDSVTAIGEYAFYACNSLTEVYIPDGVTSIENRTFYNCSSLTEVYIPDSVTTIGQSAFYDCSSLIEIHIPDGVTTIEQFTFYNCSSLTEISIPDSVTTIGASAFRECSNLTEISIPDGVTTIAQLAFASCSNLIQISIPDGVTSIENNTFISCSSLTEVYIPDSVTTIGGYAFDSCSSLTDVYYGGSEEEWENISIGSNNTPLTNATIHYNSTGLGGTELSEPELVEALSRNNSVSDNGTVVSEVTLYRVELADDEIGTVDFESFMSEIEVEITEQSGFSEGGVTVSNSYYEVSADGTSAEIKVNIMYTLGDEGTIQFSASTNGGQETIAVVTMEGISNIFDFNLSYAEYGNNDDDTIKYKLTAEISESTGNTSWEGNIWIWIISVGDYAELVSAYGGEKQSADGIDAGGTLTFTWVVEIEKSAYPDGGSHEVGFALYFGDVVLADQMLSIGVDASNGESNALNFDTDVWNFKNFPDTDDTKNKTNHVNKISDTDKTALFTNLSPSEYATVSRILIQAGPGHCFGMSLTTILSKMNIFDISDYSDASCLRDADFTDRINSILCYYQCLQKLNSFTSDLQTYALLAYDLTENGYDPKTDEEEYRQGVAEQLSVLAEAAGEVKNGGTPVLFCFGSDAGGSEWGHAVVAYGVESGSFSQVDGNTYNRRVLIYDNNSTEDDEDYYLYFNEGTNEWIIPHYYTEYGSTNENSYLVHVTNDLSILNTYNYDASLYNYIAELSMQNETAMRLANSSNEYTIPGDTSLATYSDAEILESGESSTSALNIILPDEDDDYTLTTLSGEAEELDFYLSDEDLFMSVEADAAAGSSFSIKRVFSLLGNEGSYEIKIADDDLADDEFNTYTVSGKNTGDITVELTEDGLLISGDDLTEVTVTGGDKEKEIEVIFSTVNDSALVSASEDDTKLIVQIDADADGTYETTIGSSDVNTDVERNNNDNSGSSSQSMSSASAKGTTLPQAGTALTDGTAAYIVTQAGTSVSYAKNLNTSATFAVVPAAVKIGGVTYKVTSIGDGAFKNNTKLKKITIASSVTSIGNSAFFNCTALKKVVIPAKVTKIGKKAFYNCKKLRSLIIRTKKLTAKSIGAKAFGKAGSSNYKKLKVTVPKKKYKSYKKLLKKKGLSAKARFKKLK